MSENEMLEKNETIKETVSEKLETAKKRQRRQIKLWRNWKRRMKSSAGSWNS